MFFFGGYAQEGVVLLLRNTIGHPLSKSSKGFSSWSRQRCSRYSGFLKAPRTPTCVDNVGVPKQGALCVRTPPGPVFFNCLGLVPTSRHSRQPDPETRSFQGSKASKVQESTHTRIQGCQVPRIQGSKDTTLFGPDIPTLPTAQSGNPELSRVQRFEGTRVHTYKNPRLPGSKDTRVQGYKVV